MRNKFNIRKYQAFIKEAYNKSDIIYVDFDSVISDITILKNGKFSVFFDNIIDISIEYENGFPYTRLFIQKNYAVYNYLFSIFGWEDFCERDFDSEMTMCALYFYNRDDCIAGIESHYRNYENVFFFCDC